MIIVCEPQCTSYEHVEVNSALIASVRLAFPNEKIVFFAEQEHLHYVSKNLKNLLVSGVQSIAVDVPPRNCSSPKRFPREFLLCKKVFEFAKQRGTNKVLFSSVTSTCLYAIKFLQLFFKNVKCAVIPHNILQTIAHLPKNGPLGLPFWFRFAISVANSDKIRYLVLGESIKQELFKYLPKLKRYTESIDLPYLFKDIRGKEKPIEYDVVRFGCFGIAVMNKGTDKLFKIADEVHKHKRRCRPEFILIGYLKEIRVKEYVTDSVYIPSPDTPLSRQDFDLYAREIDYSIFLHKADSYRLAASGALFDAFSYLKPIIAIRNPFFEYYFQKMGDIGYLCDSYEEITQVILGILNEDSKERYLQQQQNLLEGRSELSLPKLGQRISIIMNSFWKA